MDDHKPTETFVEVASPDGQPQDDKQLKPEPRLLGAVKLVHEGEIVLVPQPTADPRDPLNLPDWRKWLILFIVALYAMTGNLLASGIGVMVPLLNTYYDNDRRVNDLVTWPSFYMGLGNLIAMPIADTVGRRPVYLASNVILIAGGIWCAVSRDLGSHIGGRDFMALAAGQSEALCVLIAEETFFLHQRGNRIAWFCSLQTLGTAGFIIASSYLTNALGWRWWYGIFTVVSGVTFVLSVVFVTETKYERSAASLSGLPDSPSATPLTARQHRTRALDRTPTPTLTTTDLLPWCPTLTPNYRRIPQFYKHLLQLTIIPNILWLILTTGALLGTYIVMSAVFAPVLLAPPYSFSPNNLGLVMGSQAIVAFVVQPLAGTLSDYILTQYAQHHPAGHSNPESRLLPAILPFGVAIAACIIFGKSCAYPAEWSWAGVVEGMNALFYSFVSIVVTAFVYSMDCYPRRGHVAMVALCAGRGFIGFGISFGTSAFVDRVGYDGALEVCAVVVGVLAGCGVGLFFWGAWVRRVMARWVGDV
ncbi:MFS general substrate transporter [Aspergillus japonicus CBS 114.51]|uniref:MFS general substrate transporter n=1 Tax=Aspergillus japonicus CBS 114.51 TaxID=1448312 RepID=A0A8T8XA03_ASPJA|nr:MFS general substrate transporter [Aspergillus japonicus CBS 114.51]RAH84249.1 MFS general substrate transporter [Aspergillus japonicus CBS 114.51]